MDPQAPTEVWDLQAMRHPKSSQIFPTTRRSALEILRDDVSWVQQDLEHGVSWCENCKKDLGKANAEDSRCLDTPWIRDFVLPILLLWYDSIVLEVWSIFKGIFELNIRRGGRIWCGCRALFRPQQHLALPRQELEEGIRAHSQMQSEVWSHLVWRVLGA